VIARFNNQLLQFRWYRNGELIAMGTDSNSEIVTNVVKVPSTKLTDLGIYMVRVSNSTREIQSNEAALEYGSRSAQPK
jgi:hypothetical protein